MPIYAKPVRLLLHDMIADLAQEPDARFTREESVSWFAKHYPKIKRGTIHAHLTQASTNDSTRLHYSPKHPEHDLLFRVSSGTYRRYDPKNDPAPITKDGEVIPDPPAPTPVDDEDAASFAYERDLQNFLAKNLHIIEPDLTLFDDGEGTTGIEFDVGGRRIDILAVDRENNLVVIELKVSRGYDKVIGQLMRYMTWIEQNQADEGQKVRGMIIAREITEDLKLATKRTQDVELFEYALAVTLKRC